MIRAILLFFAITLGLFQALSFPWISLVGTPAPFLLILLFIASGWASKYVGLMGILGGMSIDAVSASPFGLWGLFYFCAAFLLRLIMDKPQSRWWWRLAWLSAAIFIQPLYAQLMAGHINLFVWIAEAFWPTLIVTILAVGPAWLMRKTAPSLL